MQFPLRNPPVICGEKTTTTTNRERHKRQKSGVLDASDHPSTWDCFSPHHSHHYWQSTLGSDSVISCLFFPSSTSRSAHLHFRRLSRQLPCSIDLKLIKDVTVYLTWFLVINHTWHSWTQPVLLYLRPRWSGVVLILFNILCLKFYIIHITVCVWVVDGSIDIMSQLVCTVSYITCWQR